MSTTATALNFPIWATGRRKNSVARVRVIPGTGQLQVNKKSLDEFFAGHIRAKTNAAAPLQIFRSTGYDFHISVHGGGVTGQAGAIKLGLSRAIIEINPAQRPALHKEGFLTRDPRMVERKKPGQPKARRRFQHSKR
jgi:small subunit ribosomal protein S9